MQCGNTECDYVEVNVSHTLLGTALESLVKEMQSALDKRADVEYFDWILENFEKRDIAFVCNYLIKRTINRPLFEHELIFRFHKKISELFLDMRREDQEFLSFLDWGVTGACPKCAYKSFRIFFVSETEVVALPINNDRIEDFDASEKAKKKGDVEYLRAQAEAMDSALAAAASRRVQ